MNAAALIFMLVAWSLIAGASVVAKSMWVRVRTLPVRVTTPSATATLMVALDWRSGSLS